MSKIIELSEGVKVLLNDRFTPKKRNEVRTIALNSNKKDVESEYKAINVFVEKVQQTKEDGTTEDLSTDYLVNDLTMEEYDKIVDAVLDIVKFDKGVHRLIGIAFNKIDMNEDEKEAIQKKMQE